MEAGSTFLIMGMQIRINGSSLKKMKSNARFFLKSKDI